MMIRTGATQAHRRIAISTPLGEDVLLLERMTATEQLGSLSQFDLDLLSSDENIDFDQILGQNVTVRFELPDDKGTRYFNGFVTRFTFVGERGEYAAYEATVRPWLWFLTRTADCRIFQKKKVPDIVKEVFREHGFTDFEDALTGSYREWEYCVQYRETDFNFVSRLMEQEGIYYYFKHEDGKHTLVLSDSISAHSPFPGYEEIPLLPPERAIHREHIHSWDVSRQVQPGVYVLNDYDFLKPKADLKVNQPLVRGHDKADFEIFDYPGEYTERGDGEGYVRARIEELQAEYETIDAQGNASGLAVGWLFTLTDHSRQDQNREHLVISATHDLQSEAFESGGGGAAGESYACSFRASASSEPFRPSRITPKPVVQGPQTAVVVGPAGEEIYTDEHGRVKVQFHWDRYGKKDENSSRWIRVAQIWAGKKWGGMYIPRIGQEVIVEFLEGDPDRPVITGRVYNADHMPPYELPREKTKSAIKSNSSTGGGGFNEIRFEDGKGKEQIFVHGEKDLDFRVKNDRREWIGNDRHLFVKRDKREKVERDKHVITERDVLQEIRRDHNLKINGKEAIEVTGSRSLTVKGDVIEAFKGSHSEQVAQSYYVKGMDVVIEGMTGLTIKVGGSFVTLNSGGVFISGAMVMLNSGGAPLSGSAASAVPPAAALVAEIADTALPGNDVTYQKQRAEMDPQELAALNAPSHKEPTEEEKSWIEIQLVDEEDQPVAGERYRITLPDGATLAQGTTDSKGLARVQGIDPGTCKIAFPDLDKNAWERI